MIKTKHWLVVAVASIFLAACSSKDEGPRHAELRSITTEVTASEVWSTRVGIGQGNHHSRLRPVHQDGVIYVAGRHGAVAAINAESGRKLWSKELGGRKPVFGRYFGGEPARLSGIAVAGSMLFVGSENGLVYAFNADNGELLWEQKVPGEVLAAPTVGEGRVVVHLGSGIVAALRARDGEIMWTHEEEVSLLSLRGTSPAVINSGGVIFGSATGKVVVLIAENGMLAWEERISVPTGSTDLERLVDVDGAPLVWGGNIYVSAFNGDLAAFDLRNGEVLWKREYGSWRGPVQAVNRIVLVDQQSHMISIDRSNGMELWRNSDLFLRSLTEPAVSGSYLVSGDRFGYLHWFNRSNGELVGRYQVGDDRIHGAPVIVDDKLIVQDAKGNVVAIRAQGQ
ncbi:outer membrane protein assembly factor BamB [Aliidiomarina halalkaliphila]|uniref:Outer membrane protein assembly factor BamB n=1 Tax=Aliidiomarina halalkaliphila TaxID=2593535 RepID=A0A552X5M5_9GAMM|nr:outer membrane protein assembly factor BamB [Aliidiomarina halalkaliphila]TRW50321.1 outer membrane protein assembly factor BamB [Aliidiomarina halalkaliphila]